MSGGTGMSQAEYPNHVTYACDVTYPAPMWTDTHVKTLPSYNYHCEQ